MICANKECAKEFDAKTHNQKYCCDECCRVATNKKIMEKYYEKKAIRSGAKRECKVCKSRLSRYNQSKICAKCEKNSAISNRSTILRMIDDIS
ncbi:MAG: hypothetical protein RLZZ328_24 [Bacteroidota bacterium]|jgi:hypothetical protein